MEKVIKEQYAEAVVEFADLARQPTSGERPARGPVPAETVVTSCGCGKIFTIIGSWSDAPRETFIKLGPQGSCSAAVTNALAVLISRLLRSGIPLPTVARVLKYDSSLCHKAAQGSVTCIVALGGVLAELEGEEPEIPAEPMRMNGTERKRITGCGYVEVGCFDDSEGTLRKVKAELARANTCANTVTGAISRLITVALAFGLAPAGLARSLQGIHCPGAVREQSSSCLDAVARAITDHEQAKVEEPDFVVPEPPADFLRNTDRNVVTRTSNHPT